MESLRSLGLRSAANMLQVSVILCWCFITSIRDNNWFFFISILAALIGLMMALRYMPRIYRVIKAKMRFSVHPSREVQEERKRIASDLHDTLGSQLVQALTLMDGQALTEGSPIKEVLERSLLDLRLIVDSMDAQDDSLTMRLARLRHRLDPVLQRKGLALHWQLCDPELGIGRHTSRTLPKGRVAHQILAVVQTSLSNTLEHAHASDIWVTLEPYESDDPECFGWDWCLSVEDNGKGFDLRAVLSDVSQSGHGVINMFKRMREIGGDLHIHPRQGGGTQVVMRWRA